MICFIPDTSDGFFKALFIFSGGLLYDYSCLCYSAYRINQLNGDKYNYQFIISIVGIFSSILFFVLAIIGLFNIVGLDINGQEVLLNSTSKLLIFSLKINFVIILRVMAILPFMTTLELFNRYRRVLVPQDLDATA